VPTTKSTFFTVTKDKWNTKEGIGKSLKNVQYCMYSGMAKGTSLAEATSNSEKIKPVALVIVELRKSVDIKQAGRQLVSQSVSRKFC